MTIRTVTVIGANGVMGTNIAAIFASFGNAKVYMVCRNIESANKAVNKACASVKSNAIEINLIPKTYDDLKDCIPESDLIFESVSENFITKKDVFEKVSKYIRLDAVIGTGTSGLSINDLSLCFSENIKPNFLGIHMYNPPYNMTLCEVIPSKFTNNNLLTEIKEYLSTVLLRNVVEVLDKPAFMGNRIGFQFINEAMQYAERYKDNGGIDYIDSILGPFTGRSMAPLVTADFVGLDVHKAIVDNVYDNTNDYAHSTFKMPDFALKLISKNYLGRKTGCGLYQTLLGADGTKSINVYDIKTEQYRTKNKYNFPFVKHMIAELKIGNYNEAFKSLIEDCSIESKICLEFLIKYVIYSIVVTRTIGESINSADDVMAAGFNWVPPLALVDAFGGVSEFASIAKDILPTEYFSNIHIDEILMDVPKSKYDYRPFFKARG